VTTVAFSQLLLLLTWFALAALLWLLLLVARFYHNFSGEPTRHRWFIAPMVGFGIAAVRYSSVDVSAGDPFADILMALSGIGLAGLSIALYYQMTAHKSES
jgi:hypothetical protein